MPETGEQKVAEAIRNVFSVDDIPSLTNTVRKRWLTIPEWGEREVCIWGTTLGDRARIEGDVALSSNAQQQAIRRQIATIIECVRANENEGAIRIFDRVKHWAWLEQQPASVLDALYAAVSDLDAGGTATTALMDLFGITALQTETQALRAEVVRLKTCLSFIASRSECCTACPENCQETCPQHSSTSPSQPTAS